MISSTETEGYTSRKMLRRISFRFYRRTMTTSNSINLSNQLKHNQKMYEDSDEEGDEEEGRILQQRQGPKQMVNLAVTINIWMKVG